MRKLALAVCLAFACTPSIAQDKKEAKKEPTAAQKKQQERMKDCNEQAGAKKMEGDARKKFMSSCLKGASAKNEKMSPQQARMKDCNKQASDKKMKGDDRKNFMSACLKG
jgi:replication-associated recombination protein RarA